MDLRRKLRFIFVSQLILAGFLITLSLYQYIDVNYAQADDNLTMPYSNGTLSNNDSIDTNQVNKINNNVFINDNQSENTQADRSSTHPVTYNLVNSNNIDNRLAVNIEDNDLNHNDQDIISQQKSEVIYKTNYFNVTGYNDNKSPSDLVYKLEDYYADVTSISHSTLRIVDSKVSLTMTVANTGRLIGTFYFDIYVEKKNWYGGWDQVNYQSVKIYDINPGGSKSNTFYWTPSSTGEYRYVGKVLNVPRNITYDTLTSTGYQVFNKPSITSTSVTPTSISQGGTLSFGYKIYNDADTSIQVGLGATIKSSQGQEYYDSSRDTIKTVAAKTETWLYRDFITTSSIPTGNYQYVLIIWSGNPGSTTQYSSSGWKTGPTITAVNHNPTLSTPIVSPTSANYGSTIKYEVYYQDYDGDWPSRIEVNIDGSGSGKTFPMTYISDTPTSTNGALYRYQTSNLAVGSSHSYYFFTEDGKGGSNMTSTYSGPTINVVNQSPSVSISSPADNSTVSETTSIKVSAYDFDVGDKVSKVEYYVDGLLKFTDPFPQTATPSSSWNWNTRDNSNGWHDVKVTAYDLFFHSTSATNKYYVNNVNCAPTISDISLNNSSGDINTNFTFKVKYTDIDNNEPLKRSIKIYKLGYELNGTFVKDDSNDNNYTDGVWYSYSTNLPRGAYSYDIRFNDNINDHSDASTGASGIPNVTNSAPKYQYNTNISPKLGATDIGIGSYKLIWDGAFSDIEGDQMKYEVYFGTNQSNLSKQTCENELRTDCIVSGLVYEQNYYWQIKAIDNYSGGSKSGLSEILSFSTIPTPKGTLKVKVNNIAGGLAGIPNTQGKIKLYKTSDTINPYKEDTTDKNNDGTTTFSNLPIGDYFIRVWYMGAPWGWEYWGQSSNMTVIAGSNNTMDYTRNQPTGVSVSYEDTTTGTAVDMDHPLTLGHSVKAKITVKNNRNVEIPQVKTTFRLFPPSGAYEEKSSSTSALPASSTKTYEVTYTPTTAGTYQKEFGVYNVDFDWGPTDTWDLGDGFKTIAANQPSIANAGPDQRVDEGKPVILDGSLSYDSDEGDYITNYQWWEGTTLLGSGVRLIKTFPVGSHNVMLKVTDNYNNSQMDYVTIIVSIKYDVSLQILNNFDNVWESESQKNSVSELITSKIKEQDQVAYAAILALTEPVRKSFLEGILSNALGTPLVPKPYPVEIINNNSIAVTYKITTDNPRFLIYGLSTNEDYVGDTITIEPNQSKKFVIFVSPGVGVIQGPYQYKLQLSPIDDQENILVSSATQTIDVQGVVPYITGTFGCLGEYVVDFLTSLWDLISGSGKFLLDGMYYDTNIGVVLSVYDPEEYLKGKAKFDDQLEVTVSGIVDALGNPVKTATDVGEVAVNAFILSPIETIQNDNDICNKFQSVIDLGSTLLIVYEAPSLASKAKNLATWTKNTKGLTLVDEAGNVVSDVEKATVKMGENKVAVRVKSPKDITKINSEVVGDGVVSVKNTNRVLPNTVNFLKNAGISEEAQLFIKSEPRAIKYLEEVALAQNSEAATAFAKVVDRIYFKFAGQSNTLSTKLMELISNPVYQSEINKMMINMDKIKDVQGFDLWLTKAANQNNLGFVYQLETSVKILNRGENGVYIEEALLRPNGSPLTDIDLVTTKAQEGKIKLYEMKKSQSIIIKEETLGNYKITQVDLDQQLKNFQEIKNNPEILKYNGYNIEGKQIELGLIINPKTVKVEKLSGQVIEGTDEAYNIVKQFLNDKYGTSLEIIPSGLKISKLIDQDLVVFNLYVSRLNTPQILTNNSIDYTTNEKIVNLLGLAESRSQSVIVNNTAANLTNYNGIITWNAQITLQSGINNIQVYSKANGYSDSESTSINITLDDEAPIVMANPEGGLYEGYAKQVQLSSPNDNRAVIYYTLDGSIPTVNSSIYKSPISKIYNGTTLKYFAKDQAGNCSMIKTELYQLVEPPQVVLDKLDTKTSRYLNSRLVEKIKVNLPNLWSESWKLNIEKDGYGIMNFSQVYVAASGNSSAYLLVDLILFNGDNTYKLYFQGPNNFVTSKTIFNANVSDKITLRATPPGDTYQGRQNIQLSADGVAKVIYQPSFYCPNDPNIACIHVIPQSIEQSIDYPIDNSDIHYTIDQSMPNSNSTSYLLPISIYNNSILKFIALGATNQLSDTKTEEYFIEPVDNTPPTKPWLNPTAPVVNQQKVNFSGTKEYGSSILINGQEIVSTTNSTDWVYNDYSLVEGLNKLIFTSKDKAGNESEANTIYIKLDTIAPTVTVTPSGGVYDKAVDAILSSNDPEATIYYRLVPVGGVSISEFTKYVLPIKVDKSAILNYYATDKVGNVSSIKDVKYIIYSNSIIVNANPSGGTYPVVQKVELIIPQNLLELDRVANIYYTLDGSNPTNKSKLYKYKIRIDKTTTLKFIAIDQYGIQSRVFEEKYIINLPNVQSIAVKDSWKMISVSSELTDLSSTFGENCEIYEYNHTTGEYDSVSDKLVPGKGYWVKVKEDQTIHLPVDSNQTNNFPPVAYNQGYVMISGELLKYYNNVKFNDGTTIKNLTEAISAGWIKYMAYYYDNNSYNSLDLQNINQNDVIGRSFWLRFYKPLTVSFDGSWKSPPQKLTPEIPKIN